jgi:hypothetical protein
VKNRAKIHTILFKMEMPPGRSENRGGGKMGTKNKDKDKEEVVQKTKTIHSEAE